MKKGRSKWTFKASSVSDDLQRARISYMLLSLFIDNLIFPFREGGRDDSVKVAWKSSGRGQKRKGTDIFSLWLLTL